MIWLLIWNKVKGWVIGTFAIFSVLLAAVSFGWFRGRAALRQSEETQQREEIERGQKTAQEIQQSAEQAVITIARDGQTLPPPDAEKRNDFDNKG